MGSPNVGWMFYKEMYMHLEEAGRLLTLDEEYIKHINKEIIDTPFNSYLENEAKQNILLKTMYPGLVIGSGYNHNAKDCPENFDFGFFFDHTSGMPILPGSSVKGMIRSLFKKLDNSNEAEAVLSFFRSVFKKYNINANIFSDNGAALSFLTTLEKNIFDGINQEENQMDVYHRDKFFDAVIVKGDEEGLILADDYITPHYQNLLKEPEPNKMLKVRSDVTFQFRFELYDYVYAENMILTADQKTLICLEILLFLGIGAKTNVGYGQFAEPSEDLIEKFIDKNAVKITVQAGSIVEEIKKAEKAKQIKNKLKNYSVSEEEKNELLEIVNRKIIDSIGLAEDWHGSSIEEWFKNDELSNKKKKDIIKNDFFDVLKSLLK